MILWYSCPRSTYGGDFLTKKALATAIGYGKKSDFTHCLTVSPSADKYNLKSFWDENIAKKKGPSFGLNREVDNFQFRKFHLTVMYPNKRFLHLLQPYIIMKRKAEKDLHNSLCDQKLQSLIKPKQYSLKMITLVPEAISIHKFRRWSLLNTLVNSKISALVNQSKKDSLHHVNYKSFSNLCPWARQLQINSNDVEDRNLCTITK